MLFTCVPSSELLSNISTMDGWRSQVADTDIVVGSRSDFWKAQIWSGFSAGSDYLYGRIRIQSNLPVLDHRTRIKNSSSDQDLYSSNFFRTLVRLDLINKKKTIIFRALVSLGPSYSLSEVNIIHFGISLVSF